MGKADDVGFQSMQYMLTEVCVYSEGFGQQIAQRVCELLGGSGAVLIFDESIFAKKGGLPGGRIKVLRRGNLQQRLRNN